MSLLANMASGGRFRRLAVLTIGLVVILGSDDGVAQSTTKPVLHGRHWVAITGKPLGATAGALIFGQGGNAVDAACAMLAATSTMWDVLSWGGETQALIFNPHTQSVVGINAVGTAPSGATAEFFRDQGLEVPPRYGPPAAVTPGTSRSQYPRYTSRPGSLVRSLTALTRASNPACG